MCQEMTHPVTAMVRTQHTHSFSHTHARTHTHTHTNTADAWTKMVPTHHCQSTINTRAIVVPKKTKKNGGSQTVPIKVTVACTT